MNISPARTVIAKNSPGAVGIVWGVLSGRPRILRVLLPSGGRSGAERARELYPEAREGICPEIGRTAAALAGMLEGEAVTVPLETAALETCSPFRQAVYRAAYRIPRGSVSTYGELAERLGRVGAARAVGNALAANPFPLIVPCHRVIRSDGRIGGFTGGAGLKRKLLEIEGILFDRSGRPRPAIP